MEAALLLENEMSGSETFSTTAGADRAEKGLVSSKAFDRQSSLGIPSHAARGPAAHGLYGLSLLSGNLALPHGQHDWPNGHFIGLRNFVHSPQRLYLPPDCIETPDLRHGDGSLQGDAGVGTGNGSEQPLAFQQSDPGSVMMPWIVQRPFPLWAGS